MVSSKFIYAATAFAALSLTSFSAHATRTIEATATINSAQEVPTNNSTANGTAVLRFNFNDATPTSSTFDFSARVLGLNFRDVTNEAQRGGFHIHNNVPGVNGPIVIDFLDAPFENVEGIYADILNADNQVIGFTANFLGFSLVGNRSGAAARTPEQLLNNLLSNALYVNIHNAQFPGGIIRGNFSVPEPASLALFGAGLLGLTALRRRKTI